MDKLKMYQFDDLPAGIQDKFIARITKKINAERPGLRGSMLEAAIFEELNTAEFLCMGDTSFFMIDIVRDQVN